MPITDESSPDDPIVQSIRIWIENIDINNERSETEKIYAIYSVKSLYAQNEFKPFWNENHEIIEFIEEISQAYLEGLEPGDYHYYRLSELINLSQPTISQKAELDLLLTDSFLLYASHLLSGKVDPVTVDAEWHVVRREGNPVEIFSKTVKSNKFNESIDDIKPRNSQYNGLKTALKRYLDVEESGGWTMIVNGPVINTGMKDPRVAEVRKRLAITGDYSFPSSFLEDSIYDNSLAESVTRFQRRHGFKGDGKIDEPTIRMMNIPVEERINQIILNLERWRWMPSEFSNYFLLVNIANYNLDIYRQNKIEQSYKIIAGKPVRKTPVFSSRLSYLVFNPTWTVPPTILKEDVIPEARKSTDYLRKKNIRILDSNGDMINLDSVNWMSPIIQSYTFRQDPGPANALGVVKFMFPNPYSIYLHDTPSKELFSKTDRAFSSGCIRVENPLSLAEYLLNDRQKWNEEEIKKVIASNTTQTVTLKQQPDIHILYWTCWEKNGDIFFRKDIYERDSALLKALKESPRIDIGN